MKKTPQNPPQCRSCGAPQVERYQPHFWPKDWQIEEIVWGNWIHLERCTFCGALWFVARDAGHASQSYTVRWHHSIEEWQWLDALHSDALREWHDDQFLTPPAHRVDLEALLRERISN